MADRHPFSAQVEDLWKLFRVGDEVVRAVAGVDLEIAAGEFVCVMGPSGSGKSTLLHLLGGLDRPTKGSVRLDGRETAQLTESQWSALRHSTIGFIFQSFNLIPFLSALENAELPLIFEPIDRAELRTRALELLDMVGLSHRTAHTPDRLSGGEQQRVAIARAVISSPRLVLADEPTANLDRRAGADVIELLRGLCERTGVAVVAATHDPAVAQTASRVVHMEDGRLVGGESSPRAAATVGDSI